MSKTRLHAFILSTIGGLGVLASSAAGGTAFVMGEARSELVRWDLTGDCFVLDDDIGIALAQRIDLTSVPDLDNDRSSTGADTLLLIERMILSSIGDANVDGHVDVHDLLAIASAFGETGDNRTTDVNGDRVVDGFDLAVVLGGFGKKTVDAEAMALELFDLVVYLDDLEGKGRLTVSRCDDSLLPDNWPDGDHHTAISNFYPSSHGGVLSDLWPPSHIHSLSAAWTPCSFGCHGTLTSISEQWPANHLYLVSQHWRPQGDPSAPHHESNISAQWRPNHAVDVSSTYPGVHAVVVSAVWPSNHLLHVSNNHQWPHTSDHHTIISGTWTHSQTTSVTWPPSHGNLTSQTWAPGHVTTTSIGWPSSHSSFVSASWPPNSYPGIWPPNHLGAVSTSWGNPPPVPPGLFPPGHGYVTSILDLPIPGTD